MPQVHFTVAARADLNDAVTWYETYAPTMVPAFRQAVRDVVARIGQNPRQFPPSFRGTRKALLQRFPYLVIFSEADKACFVVAIFHTRRDPQIRKAGSS